MLLNANELYPGETVYVLFKNSSDSYTWGSIYVPVFIDKEFSYFFTGTVLPHKNPHGDGESYPYNVTLNKFDIDNRITIVKTYVD